MNSHATRKPIGEHDEVHAGKERRIERQHAQPRPLVGAIADGEQARRRGAEIDHHDEEGGKRVHAEAHADPRQSERQHDVFDACAATEQLRHASKERDQRNDEACAIDDGRAGTRAPDADGKDRQHQQ
jgi:hypothetical protein